MTDIHQQLRNSCESSSVNTDVLQINDQGREFVNDVSHNLHEIVGIRTRVTSAYHPQSDGMVKRHNRTMENETVKVLDENFDQ